MKMKVFVIYDNKAEAFSTPECFNTTGLAVRSFNTACQTEGHDFFKYPMDYSLLLIGSYDPSNASFELETAPVQIALAVEGKKLLESV